tara:strand:+ start:459 stop:626 length:168 start_codon:yes stop_codon:yes gene_type:complete
MSSHTNVVKNMKSKYEYSVLGAIDGNVANSSDKRKTGVFLSTLHGVFSSEYEPNY